MRPIPAGYPWIAIMIQNTMRRANEARKAMTVTIGIESAKKPREPIAASAPAIAVLTANAPPVTPARPSSSRPPRKPKSAARHGLTRTAYHTVTTRNALGRASRIFTNAARKICPNNAPASHSPAVHHAGSLCEVLGILARKNDDAIERARIDGGFYDCRLIEQFIAAFDLDDAANDEAGMKRTSLAGNHGIAKF